MAFQWEKFEAWRKHPMLQFKPMQALPGLGLGFGAFLIYVAYDKTLGGSKKASH